MGKQLSETELKGLWDWIMSNQALQHGSEKFLEGEKGLRYRAKLMEMGPEPVTGREAVTVKDLQSARHTPRNAWWANPATGPATDPLESLIKEMKGKTVLFQPSKVPATNKDWMLEQKIRTRRGIPWHEGTPGNILSGRALMRLGEKGANVRTKLYERMLGAKAQSLPKGFKVILPLLALAALLGDEE